MHKMACNNGTLDLDLLIPLAFNILYIKHLKYHSQNTIIFYGVLLRSYRV